MNGFAPRYSRPGKYTLAMNEFTLPGALLGFLIKMGNVKLLFNHGVFIT